MDFLKKWSILSILIICFYTLSACGNSNANNQTKSGNEVKQNSQPEQQKETTGTISKIQTELDKAKKAGKAVFVVVTGTGSADTDKAIAIAKSANGIYKNATVIELNRDDATNAKLVAEWRLAGAPLPLLLTLSAKGYLVGGFLLEQATSDKLAGIVPSPKLDNVYEALNNQKSVMIVLSKKSYLDRTKIVANCNEAKSQLKNKAEIIEIDLDDTKEASTIKQLGSQIKPNVTSTIVINSSGQTTGAFDGAVEADQLVLAATKVVKSSCCPGGSSSGCK